MDAYLPKPVDPSALNHIIESFMETAAPPSVGMHSGARLETPQILQPDQAVVTPSVEYEI
jgi:hypothetical protein